MPKKKKKDFLFFLVSLLFLWIIILSFFFVSYVFIQNRSTALRNNPYLNWVMWCSTVTFPAHLVFFFCLLPTLAPLHTPHHCQVWWFEKRWVWWIVGRHKMNVFLMWRLRDSLDPDPNITANLPMWSKPWAGGWGKEPSFIHYLNFLRSLCWNSDLEQDDKGLSIMKERCYLL